jgi:secondary thiamine-phosphate synthase enzyme
MAQLQVNTTKKREIVDITNYIEKNLKGKGVVNIFLKHTTAGITTADLDPGTDQDYLSALDALTPGRQWQHPHDPGHFPDHFWSAIIGTNLNVPYVDGKLQLGTWQRVVIVELDGPKERHIELSV